MDSADKLAGVSQEDNRNNTVRKSFHRAGLLFSALVSDEFDLAQIENLLPGTDIEFKTDIHFIRCVVRI